jgi:FkbM family methyltransferase
VCEGLFAFRVLQSRQAARVIGFEPSLANVRYTRIAARDNGVSDRITIEPLAVSNKSGHVTFVESSGHPDSHSIRVQDGPASQDTVECVSLDDYCSAHKLSLTPRDLIKVDAEGSDFDVLRGAERLIRTGSPQIAVTTYHRQNHAAQMVEWLKQVQPAYRLRLKGFSFWTPKPTPVLLQAALNEN